MPNGWRTIKSLVHKIRLHGRRGKGMAESFSREKLRQAPQKEGGWKILCYLLPVWPRLVRPLKSRMNGKKHTHTHMKTGRPGNSEVPRNPLTRWDVSSIPANGIFLTKKLKNKIKLPNEWRTIKSLVHKIRLHGRRGKGMAESFSREKLRHAPQKERWMRNPAV